MTLRQPAARHGGNAGFDEEVKLATSPITFDRTGAVGGTTAKRSARIDNDRGTPWAYFGTARAFCAYTPALVQCHTLDNFDHQWTQFRAGQLP
jgi:hypothetical protein